MAARRLIAAWPIIGQQSRGTVAVRLLMVPTLALSFAAPAAAETAGTAAGTTPGISGAVLASSAPTGATSTATTLGGGRSSPPTTAPASTSNVAPAWILCPPPGAVGAGPFLDGTDLSCAPQ